MKIVKSLGLLYAVPLALLVLGVVGGLVLGEGLYVAAFGVGVAGTLAAVFAVAAARMNAREKGTAPRTDPKRIAAAAVVTVVLVAVGLLPLRTELSGGPDLFTADGLAAGLGELRGVSANYDQIYIEQGVLRGQIGSRSVIYRDGDLTTGPDEAARPDPKYVFDLGEVDFTRIPGLIDLARQRFPGGGQVVVYVSRPAGGGPVEIAVRVDLPAPEGSGELLADASGEPRG